MDYLRPRSPEKLEPLGSDMLDAIAYDAPSPEQVAIPSQSSSFLGLWRFASKPTRSIRRYELSFYLNNIIVRIYILTSAPSFQWLRRFSIILNR